MNSKSVFIASDLHLGAPNAEVSKIREKYFVAWLQSIQPFASEVILLGDVFDFWFEYRHVVPKGYVRLLGQLATLGDSGIQVQIFSGNHDLWLRDYLTKEIGAQIFHQPQTYYWFEKRYFLAHGDGLGPGDWGYKCMKRIFQNRVCQWAFRNLLHPDWGIGMANYFSHKSRKVHQPKDVIDYGEKERLYQFVKSALADNAPHYDYYVFGHRHMPREINIESAKLIMLGDWIKHFTYLEISEQETRLKQFSKND
jgi:UDP-2,3-diacylglucosamine hydrolase